LPSFVSNNGFGYHLRFVPVKTKDKLFVGLENVVENNSCQ